MVGENSATINACVSSGTIKGSSSNSSSFIGGISGTNSSEIYNCTVLNTAIIDCSGFSNTSIKVGGISGSNSNSSYIYNSFSNAKITSVEKVITGGVAGNNTGTISNCYSAGSAEVSEGSVSSPKYTGGLVGSGSGKIKYSYYLSSVSSCIGTGTTTGCGNFTNNIGNLTAETGNTLEYGNLLLEALNNRVTDQNKLSNNKFFNWTKDTIEPMFNLGYPYFAVSQNANYDTSWYFENRGTSSDPFIIADEYDMRGLAMIVNGSSAYKTNPDSSFDLSSGSYVLIDKDSFESKYLKVSKDFKMNENFTADSLPASSNITIGNSFVNKFMGTFDGDNKTISYLCLNTDESDIQGLFGCNGGTIKNLNLSDSYINGENDIGSIVGVNEGGKVENCETLSTGIGVTVKGVTNIGGIAGDNKAGGLVTNCTSASTVTATNEGGTGFNRVGGIVGRNNKAMLGKEGTVDCCVNTGTVTANGTYYIGGIAGQNYNNGEIRHCTNQGKVIGNGKVYMGGVVGWNMIHCILSDCENEGIISGNVTQTSTVISMVGGIVGFNEHQIRDSANKSVATINCNNFNNSANVKVGGIVGQNSTLGSVKNTYNTSTMTILSNNITGGIVGNNLGIIKNSYSAVKGISPNNLLKGGVAGKNSGDIDYAYYLSGTSNVFAGTGTAVGSNCKVIGTNTDEISIATLLNNLNTWVSAKIDSGYLSWDNTDSSKNNGYPYFSNTISQKDYDTSWYFLNKGTIDDPFLISDVYDLRGLAKLVSGMSNTYRTNIDRSVYIGNGVNTPINMTAPEMPDGDNKTYSFNNQFVAIAVTEIDLNPESLETIPQWTPIGDVNKPFAGTFDGRDCVIKNMQIGIAINNRAGDYQGLFGCVSGTVRNVVIQDSSIFASNNVGSIVGYLDGGIVEASSVSCTVNGVNNVGGVVGYNLGGGIDDCLNSYDPNSTSSSVAGDTACGGIVGNNCDGLVRRCTNTASVSGKTQTGGIAGLNAKSTEGSGGKVELCNNFGNITGTDENAEDNFSVGGIVGENNSATVGSRTGIGESCLNSGIITANGKYNIGGIVGLNTVTSTNIGLIQVCTNKGDIIGNGQVNIGGVTGYNSSNATTDRVFNLGSISGAVEGASNVGGVIGLNDNIATNCASMDIGSINCNDFITSTTSNVGGVIGKNNTGSSLRNAYCTAKLTIRAIDNTGGVVGDNSGTIENAYSAVSFATGATVTSLNGGVAGNNSGSIDYAYYLSGTSNGFVGSGTDVGKNCKVIDINTNEISIETLLINLNNWVNANENYFVWTKDENFNNTYPYFSLTYTVDYDTSWYKNNAGTKDNPYIISDNFDLHGLALIVGGDSPYETDHSTDPGGNPTIHIENGQANTIAQKSFTGKYFKVTADIDLSIYQALGAWVPIGKNMQFPFQGFFDGCGYKIKNLIIDSGDNVGLFGFNSGTIQNLGIINSTVKGDDNAGVVGVNTATGIVQNCYNQASVEVHNGDGGGIVGENWGHVANCHNIGAITAIGNANAGGIVGKNAEGATVEYCYGKINSMQHKNTIESLEITAVEGSEIRGSGVTLNCATFNEYDVNNNTDLKVTASGTQQVPKYYTSGSTPLLKALQAWVRDQRDMDAEITNTNFLQTDSTLKYWKIDNTAGSDMLHYPIHEDAKFLTLKAKAGQTSDSGTINLSENANTKTSNLYNSNGINGVKLTINNPIPDSTANIEFNMKINNSTNITGTADGEVTGVPVNFSTGDQTFSLTNNSNISRKGEAGYLEISLNSGLVMVVSIYTYTSLSASIISGKIENYKMYNDFPRTATNSVENVLPNSDFTAQFVRSVEGNPAESITFNRGSGFSIPENTKITLCDYSTEVPTFYYYKVSSSSNITIPLTSFTKMGFGGGAYANPSNINRGEIRIVVNFSEVEQSSQLANGEYSLTLNIGSNPNYIATRTVNYSIKTVSDEIVAKAIGDRRYTLNTRELTGAVHIPQCVAYIKGGNNIYPVNKETTENLTVIPAVEEPGYYKLYNQVKLTQDTTYTNQTYAITLPAGGVDAAIKIFLDETYPKGILTKKSDIPLPSEDNPGGVSYKCHDETNFVYATSAKMTVKKRNVDRLVFEPYMGGGISGAFSSSDEENYNASGIITFYSDIEQGTYCFEFTVKDIRGDETLSYIDKAYVIVY